MVDPLNLIMVLALGALVPFIAIMATSFVKIAVVLSIIRNALGVQQIPPNMALNGLALVLTGYIMAPVLKETYELLAVGDYNYNTVTGLKEAFDVATGPILRFLQMHAADSEKLFFLESARSLWPQEMLEGVTVDHISLLLPAFTLTQLREAFEIGFLLYLPFIAIDLIVSNILLAMGMMMVSPQTISLPFKLFLFVMVDGWSKLVLGLVRTYMAH